MGELHILDLLSAWALEGPWAIQPIPQGANNRSYTASTPHQRYILRLYQNSAEPDQVRYEHTLLSHLATMGLSFSVPAPLPTRSGATLLLVREGAAQTLAALFPLIPGQHPDGSDLAHFRICGAALGELDQACSHITIPAPPEPPPSCADLSRIHPAVPDVLRMLEHVPVTHHQRARLIHIVGTLEMALPTMYAALPWQIVHRDFCGSNVLIEGERVTAILDFEFAGPDLRGLDLARSLSQFTGGPPWSSPDGWQRVTAFAEGYCEHLVLTPGEIEAFPDMMRLYRTVSLIHREGRRRQGLASEADVRARALALLRQEEWLSEKRLDLAQLLMP